MNSFKVSESTVIDAPAAHVYDILADYHVGHAAIVPKKYFKNLEVLEGGIGAGTKLLVQMEVMGTKADFHLDVTEPEPGRILEESDAAAGITTQFIIEPLDGGSRCQTTISSVNRVSPGIRGWVEKLITPMITRRIYKEELAILADYATQTQPTAASFS